MAYPNRTTPGPRMGGLCRRHGLWRDAEHCPVCTYADEQRESAAATAVTADDVAWFKAANAGLDD